MAKLYPPQLEGSLPAFYNTYEDGEAVSTTINIPFGMNRTVSINSIDHITLRMRTTSTNTEIVSRHDDIMHDLETGIATFRFDYNRGQCPFNESQYYRVQLAFMDKSGEIGYYSTVGIIKCVARPTALIGNNKNKNEFFQVGEINMFDNTFYGIYQQDTYFGDSTEKVYSYIFNIYNEEGEIVATSGEQIHDATQDTASDKSQDVWHVYEDFTESKIYNVQYIVTTINGLVVPSITYKIMKIASIPPEFEIKLTATNDIENGCIKLAIQGNTKYNEINYINIGNEVTYQNDKEYYLKLSEERIIKAKVTDLQYYSNIKYYEFFQGLYYEYNFTSLNDWKKKVNNGELYFDKEYELWSKNKSEFINKRDKNELYEAVVSVGTKEVAHTGFFLITRSDKLSNYTKWVVIRRFTLQSEKPSEKGPFLDMTIEQGMEYQYAIQQYNNYDIYSSKVVQTDSYGNPCTIMADFEDMYLSDGIRSLRIRFNPKMSKFGNTIPEQKLETIGSKYPFIFRNGSVCYKEFPISGLISYQMDTEGFFLTDEEIEESDVGIRDYEAFRGLSKMASMDSKRYGHEITYKKDKNGFYSPSNGFQNIDKRIQWEKDEYGQEYINQMQFISPMESTLSGLEIAKAGVERSLSNIKTRTKVKSDRNLTRENIFGERYFKLKVLEWLSDGQVKLFRSPTEGNYLVRLLKVSLKPQDKLGRMLHTFSCTAYEIDEVTYENLIKYGIITSNEVNNFERHWGTINIEEIIREYWSNPKSQTEYEDGFIKVTSNDIQMLDVTLSNFQAGDQIKVIYNEGSPNIFTIGLTGTLDLNKDNRKISEIWIKTVTQYKYNNSNDFEKIIYSEINDFDREITYSMASVSTSRFDNVMGVSNLTRTAEQFVGPKTNLLEPLDLRSIAYGKTNSQGNTTLISASKGRTNILNDLKARKRFNYNIETFNNNNSDIEKFKVLKVDILHVWKREIIPIFAYNTEIDDNGLPHLIFRERTTSAGQTYTHLLTNFGITPYGIGYVNYKNTSSKQGDLRPITEYVDNTGVNETENISTLASQYPLITEDNVLKQNSNYTWSKIQGTKIDGTKGDQVDIHDIYTVLKVNNLIMSNTGILQVFVYDDINQEWIPSIDNGYQYYDCYTQTWWGENETYNPYFAINSADIKPAFVEEDHSLNLFPAVLGSNRIYLNETNEILLYNLGNIDYIELGNGVVAEVTAQMRVVDYDIEETNLQVYKAKNAYLNKKQEVIKDIDSVLVDVEDPVTIQTQLANAQEQLRIYNQWQESGNNTLVYQGVQNAAKTKIIDLKKALYDNKYNIIKGITQKILPTIKMYGSFDDDITLSVVNRVVINSFSESNEVTPYANKNSTIYKNQEGIFPDKTNREIHIYQAPSLLKTIDGFGTYNFIDNINYIDEKYWTAKLVEDTNILNEYTDSMNYYRTQIGNLLGGYLSIDEYNETRLDLLTSADYVETDLELDEYNEDNLPPENTKVYYLYQIQQTKNKEAEELKKINARKVKLMSKLLALEVKNGYKFTDGTQSIWEYTDKYIQDSASTLFSQLSNKYLQDRNNKLNAIRDQVTHDLYDYLLKDNNDTKVVIQEKEKELLQIIKGSLPKFKKEQFSYIKNENMKSAIKALEEKEEPLTQEEQNKLLELKQQVINDLSIFNIFEEVRTQLEENEVIDTDLKTSKIALKSEGKELKTKLWKVFDRAIDFKMYTGDDEGSYVSTDSTAVTRIDIYYETRAGEEPNKITLKQNLNSKINNINNIVNLEIYTAAELGGYKTRVETINKNLESYLEAAKIMLEKRNTFLNSLSNVTIKNQIANMLVFKSGLFSSQNEYKKFLIAQETNTIQQNIYKDMSDLTGLLVNSDGTDLAWSQKSENIKSIIGNNSITFNDFNSYYSDTYLPALFTFTGSYRDYPISNIFDENWQYIGSTTGGSSGINELETKLKKQKEIAEKLIANVEKIYPDSFWSFFSGKNNAALREQFKTTYTALITERIDPALSALGVYKNVLVQYQELTQKKDNHQQELEKIYNKLFIYIDPTKYKIYEAIAKKIDNESEPYENNISNRTLKEQTKRYRQLVNLDTLLSTTDLKSILDEHIPMLGFKFQVYNVYGVALEEQIKLLESQIRILKDMKDFTSSSDRQFLMEYTDPNPDFNKFNNVLAQIENEYIEKSSNIITNWLRAKNNDYHFAVDSQVNELTANNILIEDNKAFEILTLFTDDLNRQQSTLIKKYLEQYYPAQKTTTQDLTRIAQQIQDLDNIYIARIAPLEAIIADANNKIEEIDNEIQTIRPLAIEFSNKVEQQEIVVNNDQSYLNKANALRDENILDTNLDTNLSLLKDNVNNNLMLKTILQDTYLNTSANVLKTYLNYLLDYNKNLSAEVGQLYSGINTSKDYLNLLKQFINAYEEEAFQFLHKYDSIIQDLQSGLTNSEYNDLNFSTDRFFELDTYNFFLSGYKDILYLGKNETNINNLSSLDKEIRLNAYNQIKEELEDTLMQKNETKITEDEIIKLNKIGIIYNNKNATSAATAYLVYMQEDANIPQTKFYPELYLIHNQKFELITTGIENGNRLKNEYKDFVLIRELDFQNNDLLAERIKIELDKDDNNSYQIDPFNTSGQYYLNTGIPITATDNSTLNSIIADNNATEAYWITDPTPFSKSIELYNFLYSVKKTDLVSGEDPQDDNIFKYLGSFFGETKNDISTLSNLFIDTGIKHRNKNFDEYLGILLHNTEKDENSKDITSYERNSWQSLYELDCQKFIYLAGLFKLYIDRYEAIMKESTQIQALLLSQQKIQNYKNEITNWSSIIANCEILLQEYNIQVPETEEEEYELAIKKRQTLLIQEEAKKEQNQYNKMLEDELITEENLLEIDSISKFNTANSLIQTLEEDLQTLESQIKNEKAVYDGKVKHYINLLFNNQPQTKISEYAINNLKTIDNRDSPNYNSGLAYLIEKYRKFALENTSLNFKSISNSINNIHKMFNRHFDLLTKITQISQFNAENKFYRKLDNGEYEFYSYAAQIENGTTLKVSSKKEITQGKIYKLKYNFFEPFVNYIKYIKITLEDIYDSNETYYIYNNKIKDYEEFQILSVEDFSQNRSSKPLYIKGNGGLLGLLNLITNTNSTYITEILTTYKETLLLYADLDSKIRDEKTLTVREIAKLKADCEAQITRLNNILDSMRTASIDYNAKTNEVLTALAEYLRILTVTYIKEVEGRYDII